jgi:predicted phosphohydrolase
MLLFWSLDRDERTVKYAIRENKCYWWENISLIKANLDQKTIQQFSNSTLKEPLLNG